MEDHQMFERDYSILTPRGNNDLQVYLTPGLLKEAYKFQKFPQVVYVPHHARDKKGRGIAGHRDLEFGFITRVIGNTVTCRYFSNHDPYHLRTRANGEGCDMDALALFIHRPVDVIISLMARIVQEQDEFEKMLKEKHPNLR